MESSLVIYQLVETELEDHGDCCVEVSRTRLVSDSKRAIDAAIEQALHQGVEITDLSLHRWENGRITTVGKEEIIRIL